MASVLRSVVSNMTIRREKDITYTMVGGPLLEELEPFFRQAGFEYELLFGDDIPAELPREMDMNGHIMRYSQCCVKSYMNSEDVHQLMLQVWLPSVFGPAKREVSFDVVDDSNDQVFDL